MGRTIGGVILLVLAVRVLADPLYRRRVTVKRYILGMASVVAIGILTESARGGGRGPVTLPIVTTLGQPEDPRPKLPSRQGIAFQ